MTATVTLPAAAFERLRTAGNLLSNCAFNLAQQKGLALSPRAAQSLDECRKEWDAASEAVHQLLQAPPKATGWAGPGGGGSEG
jgi:hypothetical protein